MYNIFYNNLFLVPGIAFGIASILKWINTRISTWKELKFSTFFWSWWMTSWHSAIATALTTAIIIKDWICSDEFAIAIGFTVIIIYDALNLRYESGKHAEALNEIIWKKKFNESLGHLPSEVFAGSLVGIATALILWFV
jgi:acid phosphatase family membrane protein YuiD